MSDLDLKLPIMHENLSSARPLSMDEYYKFVQFNLKYISNKKADVECKKIMAVNVPFLMK